MILHKSNNLCKINQLLHVCGHEQPCKLNSTYGLWCLCERGHCVVHVVLVSPACHLCMDMLSSPRTLPKGMMGAYGPPYMPMQGPHEGLLSVAPMPPHPTGGPHLPPHHLQQGMPGYPGMPHQGKGRCPSHTCKVTSSRVSPAGGVYLVHRLRSLIFSLSSQSSLVSNKLF